MYDYIPDLTERYPEGFDGVDMFAPRDLEAEAWADFEREYLEAEREAIERYNKEGFTIILQDSKEGWTFAETKDREYLLLCNIKDGEIISVYDTGRNNQENHKYMQELWKEML